MTFVKIKPIIPYIGIPVLCVVLLFLQVSHVQPFVIIQRLLLIVFGYIATVNDVKTKTIKNSLVLAMLAAWIVITVPLLLFDINNSVGILLDAILGFVTSGALFMLVYVLSRKGLGGGDVKFMAVAGLYLGFYGVLPAILVGTMSAALVGIVLLITKKINRKDSIPLAPFLYVGILVTIFIV